MSKRYSELIKSLIEWSGDNVTKEFMENKSNPFTFKSIKFLDKFEDLDKKSKIFIVFENFGFFEKIAELLTKNNNSMAIFNFIGESLDNGMKITKMPKFERKIKVEQKKVEIVESVDEEEEEIKKMWYDAGNDVWYEKEELFFPEPEIPKPFDDHNEIISAIKKVPTKKNVEKLVEEVVEEEEEEIIMEDCDLQLNAEIINLSIDCISDRTSEINVLEHLKPKNLILIGTKNDFGRMFYYLCKLNKNFNKVAELNSGGEK
jgi:hypothetical protein